MLALCLCVIFLLYFHVACWVFIPKVNTEIAQTPRQWTPFELRFSLHLFVRRSPEKELRFLQINVEWVNFFDAETAQLGRCGRELSGNSSIGVATRKVSKP